MGITADASTMLNLKKRTLPGAPGPRTIVLGGGDEERHVVTELKRGGRVNPDPQLCVVPQATDV